MPFGERMAAAIRARRPAHLVFSEPFVLFNFGQTATSLSGHRRAGERALVPRLRADAGARRGGDRERHRGVGERRRDPGHRVRRHHDSRPIRRLDGRAWTRAWCPGSSGPGTSTSSSTSASRRRPTTSAAPVRRRARASVRVGDQRHAGVASPTIPQARVLEYAWSTTRPDGTAAPGGLPTTIVLPPSAYGAGYAVEGQRRAACCPRRARSDLVVANAPGVAGRGARSSRTEPARADERRATTGARRTVTS